MERDTNIHHIWWVKNNYHSGSERSLRNLGGFALALYAPAHRLLHSQLRPMVKPPKFMIDDIIDFARQTPQEHRFSVLEDTADFLLDTPYEQEQDNVRAARLGQHLITQRGYFDLHPLTGDPIWNP